MKLWQEPGLTSHRCVMFLIAAGLMKTSQAGCHVSIGARISGARHDGDQPIKLSNIWPREKSGARKRTAAMRNLIPRTRTTMMTQTLPILVWART